MTLYVVTTNLKILSRSKEIDRVVNMLHLNKDYQKVKFKTSVRLAAILI